MTDEGVVLTEHERAALARLAADIDDPWLARQLLGVPPPTPQRRRPRAVPRWLGMALLALGAALAVSTFTRWWWAAAAGLVLMAIGGTIIGLSLRGRIAAPPGPGRPGSPRRPPGTRAAGP